MPERDEFYMARALQLAERGLYTTEPNPRVGCVLVRDGAVIAEGWHRRAGEGHAEVEALAAVNNQAQGATAYVTLEPCSHQGKTGPCCDALIKAGVSRVVAAMQDPNPLVAGRGFRRLEEAGVAVRQGVLEAQARALNPGFIKRMETGQPYVRIKLAMSVDGRTAMASGESQWITGAAARSDVQKLRARSSAIVTGVGTVLHDDPSMTVRAEQLGLFEGLVSEQLDVADVTRRQPLRVVLDSAFQTPPTAKIVNQPARTWIVGASRPERTIGDAELKCIANAAGRVDLKGVLEALAASECNEVLVEAGAELSGAFLQAGLVDELVIYMAPKLLGDAARPLMALPGMDKMADQVNLQITEMRSVGDDWRINAIVRGPQR
ncbi:MAG: bifunctional diaminohydroxyphosphoribosylaminopyrimidine deaminase/5-amino-6-(5-phosphoribosylamino)uracil reductase RibD [Pseudomonadales bacterium]